MAKVSATASSRFMPLKNIAMAKAATCPSVIDPELIALMKAVISAASSV